MKELESRWEYDGEFFKVGINETMSLDNCTHSLFGVSKASSDLLVQEYGRYFGINTCCLRGGCLTGPSHSGVELHGFLSYLIKCYLTNSKYTVFGICSEIRSSGPSHSICLVKFVSKKSTFAKMHHIFDQKSIFS